MIYRVLRHIPDTDTTHTQVAQALKDRASRRVLYCGEKPMYLALAMRYDNPDSSAIMIRGDKLDPGIFTPDGLEHFAWRDGVDTIVLEPGKKSLRGTSSSSTPPRTWCAIESCPARRAFRTKPRFLILRIRRTCPVDSRCPLQ